MYHRYHHHGLLFYLVIILRSRCSWYKLVSYQNHALEAMSLQILIPGFLDSAEFVKIIDMWTERWTFTGSPLRSLVNIHHYPPPLRWILVNLVDCIRMSTSEWNFFHYHLEPSQAGKQKLQYHLQVKPACYVCSVLTFNQHEGSIRCIISEIVSRHTFVFPFISPAHVRYNQISIVNWKTDPWIRGGYIRSIEFPRYC